MLNSTLEFVQSGFNLVEQAPLKGVASIMELHIKQKGDIYIIFIIRSLGITNIIDFKNEIKRLVKIGAKKVIVSFEHAKYIDSSGITTLISVNNYVKKHSVKFLLSNIHGSVKQVFSTAHLDVFFRIFGSVEKAIEQLEE